SDKVEEVILPSGYFGELVHRLLNNLRSLQIKRIRTLSRLAENIGVLRGAAHHGVVRRQGARPVRLHQPVINHGSDLFVRKLLNLHYLMRGAKAVEYMQEGNPGAESACLSD